jgi:hypothetical protein
VATNKEKGIKVTFNLIIRYELDQLLEEDRFQLNNSLLDQTSSKMSQEGNNRSLLEETLLIKEEGIYLVNQPNRTELKLNQISYHSRQ